MTCMSVAIKNLNYRLARSIFVSDPDKQITLVYSAQNIYGAAHSLSLPLSICLTIPLPSTAMLAVSFLNLLLAV